MEKRYLILIIIAAAAALPLVVFRSTVWLVACNLFQPAVTLGTESEWDGGSTWEGISYGPSETKFIDLYVPDTPEPAPLFVLIHGGGFVGGDTQTRQVQFMNRFFRDRGFACASISYRLAGEAIFPAGVEDVRDAVRFLAANAEEYGYNAEKIAIWGESAGGYLAAREALTDTEVNICALVDYYGAAERIDSDDEFDRLGVPRFIIAIANSWISDYCEGYSSCEEYWLRKPYSQWTQEDFNALSILWQAEHSEKKGVLKTLIYHGDADITVPKTQSEKLRDTISGIYGEDSVKLELFHGYTHAADRFYSDSQLAEVEEFLRDAMQDRG